MAVVGDESDRLPCRQSNLAHRRIIADLAHLAEIVHSRGFFGSLDLCRTSGERRVGGMDFTAKKHYGHVVYAVVDRVLSEVFRVE